MYWVWKAPAVASRRTRALRRRILGQFVQRRHRTCGDDLSGGVPVGRNQIQGVEPGEHLGLVAAEQRRHPGGFERAGLGHLGAAGGRQRYGVVGGDDAGDGVGGDLADGVSGDDNLGRAVEQARALASSS